jgi:hypothetical protein
LHPGAVQFSNELVCNFVTFFFHSTSRYLHPCLFTMQHNIFYSTPDVPYLCSWADTLPQSPNPSPTCSLPIFFSSHSIQPQLNFSHTTLSPTSYCMYSTTTHPFPTILGSSDRGNPALLSYRDWYQTVQRLRCTSAFFKYIVFH